MKIMSLVVAAVLIVAGSIPTPAASYTVPLPWSLTLLANSLDAGAGATLNRADQVIPYVDGDNIQLWTGASWQVWTMDSISSTGWIDPAGNDAPLTSLPILGPGRAFFYGKNSTTASITFTGAVRPTSPINVPVPVGFTALGSPHARGNTVGPNSSSVVSTESFDSGLVFSGPIALPIRDGDFILKWNGVRFNLFTRDSISATGWTDMLGADCPEPTLFMGEGFFYGNNLGIFFWSQP
ncbi:MAG: hypothetical protein QM813_12470 [Verrucomicrobiota bacterium]